MMNERKEPTQDETIKQVKFAMRDMAFGDIKRAAEGRSKMGAFILGSCFIDYLAGLYMPDADNKTRYIEFVNQFLPKRYDAKALYVGLRCKLVHCYSLDSMCVFTDGHPDKHFAKNSHGQTTLNMEDFIGELEAAMNKYFSLLDENDKVRQDAIKKVKKDGTMGVFKSQYLEIAPPNSKTGGTEIL